MTALFCSSSWSNSEPSVNVFARACRTEKQEGLLATLPAVHLSVEPPDVLSPRAPISVKRPLM